MPRLGIIIGSTRPGRQGATIADWVRQRADTTAPATDVDLIDLREVDLPFLDEPHDASTGIYTHAHTRAWSERIRPLDALILVTPEYNNSFPAPLKNALDYLADEWRGKPVALIGYGGLSSGTRAVQALLPVVTSVGMLVAGTFCIPFRQRLDNGTLTLSPDDERAADDLIRRLISTAVALAGVSDRPVSAAETMAAAGSGRTT